MNYIPQHKDKDGFMVGAKSLCHGAPIVVFERSINRFVQVFDLVDGQSGSCYRCNRDVLGIVPKVTA